ncbi:MAG: patatin-like phospholipase family protein [Proteobacteria bacterium]|nr:patatin-like phospholipase family protein [Pseudomonadota bacterium]
MNRECLDGNGSTRGFAAILLCAYVTCVAFPALSHAAEITAVEAPAQPRPRIGLVLGGGGAKGAAHLGVLGVLDEMRIPVDCIIGTSMGALVGGTYASGMSADELETAIRAISWQEAIGRRGLRAQVPMRRKLTSNTYSNSLEFGVRDGRLVAPSGLINTQNVDLTIQYLVGRSRGIAEFDRLPIPFRAVATDMQNGEMVVLDRGDLALAMRASMAVPGVFSPVNIDGRILGDGGLTRNVPVDIARQTCADVVIAVAVPNPLPTAAELRSPLTLMSRTLDVLIGANERQQLDTLGPDDVKIVIEMGDIGSASFDRVNDAIPLGRAAALAHRDALARYAVTEDEYLAWRESASRPGGKGHAGRCEPERSGTGEPGFHPADAQTAGRRRGRRAPDRKPRHRRVRTFRFRACGLHPVRGPGSIDPGPASAGEVLGSAHHALRPRAPYRHRRKHGVYDRR